MLPSCSKAWGFWAHQRINYMAVFTLPPPLFDYYRPHILYLFRHAVDPDQRRYSDPEEAPRHFIDLDRYGGTDSIPHRWEEAVDCFTADTLKEHGIVPWAIQQFYGRLIHAFIQHDLSHVLYYSACLGHYIADAHVPLHCTRNYNGQLTGQKGIHAFWESRVPELFGSGFDGWVRPAEYLPQPLEASWSIVGASSKAVDSVLSFERTLTEHFPEHQKFAFEDRGSMVVRTYAVSFAKEYYDMLDGQIERRFREAIAAVGSYWYSAWLEAGQPDLTGTPNDSIVMDMTSEPVETTVKGRDCE